MKITVTTIEPCALVWDEKAYRRKFLYPTLAGIFWVNERQRVIFIAGGRSIIVWDGYRWQHEGPIYED